MKVLRSVMVIVLAAAFALAVAACEKEGPAERAGKKIDNTVEKVQSKADEAASSMKEAMKGTAEKVQEKTDETMKAVGEKVEAAGEKMQKESSK